MAAPGGGLVEDVRRFAQEVIARIGAGSAIRAQAAVEDDVVVAPGGAGFSDAERVVAFPELDGGEPPDHRGSVETVPLDFHDVVSRAGFNPEASFHKDIVEEDGAIDHTHPNAHRFCHRDIRAPKLIRESVARRIAGLGFHDQIDCLFSGIPMNYDSAGIIRPFESAGMFEVLAFEDDSIPVYLKDGKTLNVNLFSNNDENKFNVYYLDTVAKKWLYNDHETRNHKEDLDNLSKEKEAFLAKHNLLDPAKLITPRKANPVFNNFMIDYDKEEFPELAVYDGVKFEVNAKDPNYTSRFERANNSC